MFDEAGDPYVTWEDVERMTASLAPGETLELPEDVRIRRASFRDEISCSFRPE